MSNIFTQKDAERSKQTKAELYILAGFVLAALIITLAVSLFQNVSYYITKDISTITKFSAFITVLVVWLYQISMICIVILAVRFYKKPSRLYWLVYILLSVIPNFIVLLLMNGDNLMSQSSVQQEILFSFRILLWPVLLVSLVLFAIPALKKKIGNTLILFVLSFIIIVFAMQLFEMIFSILQNIISKTYAVNLSIFSDIKLAHELNPLLHKLIIFIIVLPLEIIIFKQPPLDNIEGRITFKAMLEKIRNIGVH